MTRLYVNVIFLLILLCYLFLTHSVFTDEVQRKEVHYIEGSRGSYLLYGGYRYTIKRKNMGGSIVWRCTNRRCNGYITTFDNIIVKEKSHELQCYPNIKLCNNHDSLRLQSNT